jgi:cytidylate kinase
MTPEQFSAKAPGNCCWIGTRPDLIFGADIEYSENVMIDVEDYVKKQIAVFQANELLEKRERRPGRGKECNLSYGPYLLISRERGAGGNTVAQLVGRRLGWQVFAGEIVDEIAKTAHIRSQLIESLAEQNRTTIRDIIGQLPKSQEVSTSDYLAGLKQIVLTLGHQGDVIIVGHGARYILPGQFGLSVRMIAPVEVRVRRLADKAHLSLAAARVEIERIDHERLKSVKHNFGRNVADPLGYDLTINTGAMKAEATIEIILTALQRKLGVQIKESSQK